LFFAINEHRRRTELVARLRELEARQGARRFVHKAVLKLMDLHGIDDEQAYRLLRKESMRQRITIEQLSIRVLSTSMERARTARKA
jgi:AmiR/NasT family two-component response regulator